jgi:hypothetical protein
VTVAVRKDKRKGRDPVEVKETEMFAKRPISGTGVECRRYS